jgi:hypothetical protein
VCSPISSASPGVFRRENGDRPTPNKLALRRAQPHHHSVWFVGGGCLAVRNIFLLCFQQGGHRLVFTVRLGNVFGRSGGHLQARPFLSERTGNGAQRRTRIGAERNRASPQPAQILCSPFVLRLSDGHRRYRGLGLRGRTAPTDFSVNGNSRPTVTCIIVTSLSRPQAWRQEVSSTPKLHQSVTECEELHLARPPCIALGPRADNAPSTRERHSSFSDKRALRHHLQLQLARRCGVHADPAARGPRAAKLPLLRPEV